jgi:hypothetical protein
MEGNNNASLLSILIPPNLAPLVPAQATVDLAQIRK